MIMRFWRQSGYGSTDTHHSPCPLTTSGVISLACDGNLRRKRTPRATNRLRVSYRFKVKRAGSHMNRTISRKLTAVTIMAICGFLVTSTMSSWAAAYKPINLNLPSQLPQATQGKSYNYSLAARVTGGTGKPYKWKFSGALPANLTFNASSGKILGIVHSAASVGTYPLQVCVTGGKKGATAKIRNTICKSTNLRVVLGTSPLPATNNASGTYAGNINFPNLTPSSGITGCEAKVIARTVTLVEGAGGAITGGTNNEMMPTLTGTRVGNTITVTLQSRWGARGPYTWQWNGDSISGILPAYCWDLSTYALLNEGSYPFTLVRSGTPTYLVTVAKSGDGQGSVSATTGGINCGSTCQGTYKAGTQVTFTATASSGSAFSGWSGACTGTGSCTFTVNADTSVTATFTASASGTYSGNINYPNLNPAGTTGCEANVFPRSITLVEGSEGTITGTTNNSQVKTLSGSRSGSAVTVTLQTTWGARGPYVWTWAGSTLSGTFPAFCWNTSTMTLLNEGSYQFNLTKV